MKYWLYLLANVHPWVYNLLVSFILWLPQGREASSFGIARCIEAAIAPLQAALTGTASIQGAQPKDWEQFSIATADGASAEFPSLD